MATRAAREVRAALEATGTPMGAYDVLIAGQSVPCEATPVSAKAGEFARARGLAWTDRVGVPGASRGLRG